MDIAEARVETVEDYLARGGTITTAAPGHRALQKQQRSLGQQKGRPREEGERHLGGKLKQAKIKPTIEPIAPAAWDRARTAVIDQLNDARFGSEVGRLSLKGEISSTEAAAAFRLADIYGRFERYKGYRRSSASPSYMVASSSVGDDAAVEAITPEMLARSMAEELLDADQLADLEANIQAAAKRMEKLQKFMRQFPRNVIAALELLCVEDRNVNPVMMENIRTALDLTAEFFRIKAAPKEKKKSVVAKPFTAPQAEERFDYDKAAWLTALGKLRPDLTEPQRIEVYNLTTALKARAVLRRAKEKPARVVNFGNGGQAHFVVPKAVIGTVRVVLVPQSLQHLINYDGS